MSIDPSILGNLSLLATAFSGAFLAALWLSLIIWTYRDICKRSRDPLIRILSVLVSVVLFLPGILVYLILRPNRTLDDEYQQSLEEEALLQAIEEHPMCPGCGRVVENDWQICPNCHTKLKKVCHHCKRLLDLPWNICPYCTTPIPGTHKQGTPMEEALINLPSENSE
ncbi:MAG: zinc ribbon domain-containing protein [Anaerolineae bacterium]|jgi:RNA polymerase subunit RPABC4/transcription elongation factor Spt4|nr:zinc ribbon domain-containing protein [Anaerolineae bacterium]